MPPSPSRHDESVRVVGVDGCRTGWIAVAWTGERGSTTAHHLRTLDDVADVATDIAVVAVDMPLFVPESERTAEVALRRALGPRRSSVFATPPRTAIDAPDHAAATARARAATGKGVSRQAWNLVPKIREAIAWAATVDVPVIEAHPEGSFTELLGAPASAGKKTWAGMTQRLGALTAAGFDLAAIDLAAAEAASTDDLLDAAAAAWTADRYRRGRARSFPTNPDPAADAIWA